MTFLHRLSQLGTAAKGVIYLGTGLIAFMAAFHLRRSPEDPRGVLNGIFHQPMGAAFVAFVAATLTGFAVWRLVLAATGRDGQRKRLRFRMRVFLVLSAGIHAGLAWSAVRLFYFQRDLAHGDGPTRAFLTHVMSLPFGQFAVLATGGTTFGIGIGKLVRSYRARVWHDLAFAGVPARWQRIIVWMGRAGETARGLILLVIGLYMMQASLRYDPSGIHGFAGALKVLHRLPLGGPILAGMSAGLFCYGLFLITSARYQKI